MFKMSFHEFIKGYHTIPVDKSICFESAANKSISFDINVNDYDKELVINRILVNRKLGTHSGTT